MNDDNAAAVWFRQNLELVQADLVATLRKHWPAVGHQVIAHALIQTTGTVLGAIVQADPAAHADLDRKLADLRLFVATTDDAPH